LSVLVASIGSNSLGSRPPGQPLRFAERDALRFNRAMATQRAYNLAANLLLRDNVYAGDAAIELQSLLASAGNEDHVVLYFAGHGILEKTERGTELFLGVHGTFFDAVEASAINLQDLVAAAEQSNARSCTLLLDCCFGGGLNARSIAGPRYLADLQAGRRVTRRAPKIEGDGRLLIGAAKKDRRAYESATLKAGFFTHHLLESLYRNRREDLVPVARVYADVLVALNAATHGQQIPVFSGDDGGATLPTVETMAKGA